MGNSPSGKRLSLQKRLGASMASARFMPNPGLLPGADPTPALPIL
ncbi:MAG: hypothetical protein ABSE07_02185 [Methanoregula sp.]